MVLPQAVMRWVENLRCCPMKWCASLIVLAFYIAAITAPFDQTFHHLQVSIPGQYAVRSGKRKDSVKFVNSLTN